MRRHPMIAAGVGVLGLLLAAGDASACHHRNRCATPTTCCYTVAPSPPVQTCGTCGGHHRTRKHCGHRRAACPTPCVVAYAAPVCGAPVYAAPVYGAPAYAAPVASGQSPVIGTPQAPSKRGY